MAEILPQHLTVGIVPVPQRPFSQDDLHKLFGAISKIEPYQQFNFLPAETGAQLLNSPDDVVLLQPGLLQVRTPVMTAGRAREKVLEIFSLSFSRLKLSGIVQTGVKVIAHAPAPGAQPHAKDFVATQLLRRGDEHIEELGPSFFAGGIKYRSVASENSPREEVLLIEPYVADDSLLYIDYDVQNFAQLQDPTDLGPLIDEAFNFVLQKAASIVEGEA